MADEERGRQKNRKLVITHYEEGEKKGILSALFEDDKAVELILEPEERSSLLGNIYIGKVKKLAPQIGAAFVEIGEKQMCYYSLQENQKPLITNRRHPETKKPLVEGDELIVQVNREAVKTKAPSVTSNLSFPGKYLVITSEKGLLGVSSRLSGGERQRLREFLTPHCDGSFGVIARTNAAEAEEDVLLRELERLRESYREVLKKGYSRTCFTLLSREESPVLTILRRIPANTLSSIATDDERIFKELRGYLADAQPEDLGKLKFYEDKSFPLIKLYSLEKVLQDALRERVWLNSGGYLVIQPTEALTVVDVNSGKFEKGKKRQNTFWKINREAAIETARQLRLRNISGIVIIDFIDMESQKDREALMELLAQELRKDPVKTALVDMTKLNLVELTRKKALKSLAEQWRALSET